MTRKEMIDRLVPLFTPEKALALIELFGGDPPTPGPVAEANVQVLYVLRGANLASTADQAFTKVGDWSSGIVSQVFATNSSAAATSAAGGIYGGAGKAAPTVISASQSWAGGANPQRVINAVLATNQSRINGTLYLSLTTASTVPATADFYIFGVSTNEVI